MTRERSARGPLAWLLPLACCLLPFLASAAAPQDDQKPPSFDEWLVGVRSDARAQGISQTTIDLALTGLAPEPVVVARDRAQPEATESLDEYVAARLQRKTLVAARKAASANRGLLRRIEKVYGVPGPVTIAIWGIESHFGQFSGTHPMIAALATLAYDSRRSELFRHELLSALVILDRGLVALPDLKGSWAGAMGQPQFMPSSYLKYAVDFDGDGRADIWSSEADVLASMANYLRQKGWTPHERWGREVRVSKAVMARIDRGVPMRTEGCRALRDMTEPRPLDVWKGLGVTLATGRPLPASPLEASLVRGVHRNFLVYRNYEAIIEYNCSNAYALSVALLADRIALG